MDTVINTRDRREVLFFIIGSVCLVALLLFGGSLIVSLVTSDREQSLSGSVTVSSSWIELNPDNL